MQTPTLHPTSPQCPAAKEGGSESIIIPWEWENLDVSMPDRHYLPPPAAQALRVTSVSPTFDQVSARKKLLSSLPLITRPDRLFSLLLHITSGGGGTR